MKALVIDGPWRKRVVETEYLVFQIAVAPDVRNYLDFHLSDTQARLVRFETVTYHVHRLHFLGEEIMLASVEPLQPSNDDVFKLVLSPSARKAIRKRDDGTQRRGTGPRPPRTNYEPDTQGTEAR